MENQLMSKQLEIIDNLLPHAMGFLMAAENACSIDSITGSFDNPKSNERYKDNDPLTETFVQFSTVLSFLGGQQQIHQKILHDQQQLHQQILGDLQQQLQLLDGQQQIHQKILGDQHQIHQQILRHQQQQLQLLGGQQEVHQKILGGQQQVHRQILHDQQQLHQQILGDQQRQADLLRMDMLNQNSRRNLNASGAFTHETVEESMNIQPRSAQDPTIPLAPAQTIPNEDVEDFPVEKATATVQREDLENSKAASPEKVTEDKAKEEESKAVTEPTTTVQVPKTAETPRKNESEGGLENSEHTTVPKCTVEERIDGSTDEPPAQSTTPADDMDERNDLEDKKHRKLACAPSQQH